MTENEPTWPEVDPDSSPFEPAPVEGIPYKRGSLEDRTLKRLLREIEERDRRREESGKR